MHIHILGICGTFMGGIALLARELGFTVSGSDTNVYPPMSTQLEQAGIALHEGYDPGQLDPAPDLVVIGNVLTRGNPAVEQVLNQGLRYTSGPAFFAEYILPGRWVLGVAGTHGKTTTSSMLAWLLDEAGMAPGFLIGGVPQNFGISARLGGTPFFVLEADEYDTAFFDKRSKFVHYHPRTVILNNLEFDHADIFPDVAAIQRQFHHLVRTVPGNGLIISNAGEPHLAEVLKMGCWTPVEQINNVAQGWSAHLLEADGSRFQVQYRGEPQGVVSWPLLGNHNVSNALAALAAARHVGVPPAQGVEALASFTGVKRRMEQCGVAGGITVYDDFAHHPTAIATTLEGLRRRVAPGQRIFAVLEPRSNTMRLGAHREQIGPALAAADRVALYQPPGLSWEVASLIPLIGPEAHAFGSIPAIISYIVQEACPGDHVLVMSNGAFGGIHKQLLEALRARPVSQASPVQ